MSRNLGTLTCRCSASPVLIEPPRAITKEDAHGYFEEYKGMIVAKALCMVCGAKYLAWISNVPGSGDGTTGVSTPGVRHCDLSYRSTFNDEPGLDDVPEQTMGAIPEEDPEAWLSTFNAALTAADNAASIRELLASVDDACKYAHAVAQTAHGYTPSEYKGPRMPESPTRTVLPTGDVLTRTADGSVFIGPGKKEQS